VGEPPARASEAAACAGKQGQFWSMHEILYEHQSDIFGAAGTEQLLALMKQFASQLDGLDQATFAQCMAQRATLPAVQASDQERRRRGIIVRPVFEIGDKADNIRRIVGFRDVGAMSAELDAALAQAAP
jgi:protein-disulfide isomerase